MDRPILFSAHLVRAILDGRKTVTRRPVKWSPLPGEEGTRLTFSGVSVGDYMTGVPSSGKVLYVRRRSCWNQITEPLRCPFGAPGDRLYVRECWAAHWMYDDVPPSECRSGQPDDNYWYRADPDGSPGSCGCPAGGRRGRWRPSIHMPRWASRITLEVESVRVERLQAITEEAARAEGVEPCALEHAHEPHCCAFGRSWDRIYPGDPAWAANPWVWVVGFKVAEARR